MNYHNLLQEVDNHAQQLQPMGLVGLMCHVLFLAVAVQGMLHRSTMKQLVSETLRHQHQLLDSGAPGDCSGLMETMCLTCGSHAILDETLCKKALQTCRDVFCDSTCLKDTWTCQVNLQSFLVAQPGETILELMDRQANSEDMICREYRAGGCKEMACCPNDHKLVNFVEKDAFPLNSIPFPECQHSSVDKALSKAICSDCKTKAASIKPVIQVKSCEIPLPVGSTSASPAFVELGNDQVWTGKEIRIPFKFSSPRLEHLAVSGIRFTQTHVGTSAPGSPLMQFPGLPAHKGLRERCEALKIAIEPKLAKWIEDFSSVVCNCGGCCDDGLDECAVPITSLNK